MDEQERSAAARWTFFAVGWVFFALGVIGALLPALPTTPFMLLALWCFSRSSKRFHDWLYHHRIFGPRLQDWHEHRVIPLPVKLVAWGSMTASTAFMVYRKVPWWAIAAAVSIMLGGAIFIARCPSSKDNR